MATTKKTEPAPETEQDPEYNFSAWDSDAEDAAIAALAPKVQHIIVEKNFIGRFENGIIVKLPLTLSVDDIDELDSVSNSPTDQLKHLLTKLGGARVAAEFTAQDIAATTGMATRYFTLLQRIAQATLPE